MTGLDYCRIIIQSHHSGFQFKKRIAIVLEPERKIHQIKIPD